MLCVWLHAWPHYSHREVKVIRLVSRATIEEGMLQHAQMKLRLEKDVTYTGEL